jgi:hypothetical protein
MPNPEWPELFGVNKTLDRVWIHRLLVLSHDVTRTASGTADAPATTITGERR